MISSTLIQVAYAMGVGMLFGAVYLRTGNILVTMIAHFSFDFLEFIRSDLSASAGAMQTMGIGDWITIAAGALAGVIGILLTRKKYHAEIMEVWKDRWNQ